MSGKLIYEYHAIQECYSNLSTVLIARNGCMCNLFATNQGYQGHQGYLKILERYRLRCLFGEVYGFRSYLIHVFFFSSSGTIVRYICIWKIVSLRDLFLGVIKYYLSALSNMLPSFLRYRYLTFWLFDGSFRANVENSLIFAIRNWNERILQKRKTFTLDTPGSHKFEYSFLNFPLLLQQVTVIFPINTIG